MLYYKDMELKQPATAEEYMRMVEQFSWLVDRELKDAEKEISDSPRPWQGAGMLPKLISLVNVIGYMRGQDGVFLDSRPFEVSTQFQSDLYKNEDSFEGRLNNLIVKVCETSEGVSELKRRIEEYYILHRLPRERQ